MIKKTEVNINCPTCGTPLTTIFLGKDVKGIFQHKCGKCKRYWKVDYTNQTVAWVKGKEESTSIKEFQLNLATGNSLPFAYENIHKALLRREGA